MSAVMTLARLGLALSGTNEDLELLHDPKEGKGGEGDGESGDEENEDDDAKGSGDLDTATDERVECGPRRRDTAH